MDSPWSGGLISVTSVKVHLAIAHLWGMARNKHEVRLSKPTYNCSPSTDSSTWTRDREEYGWHHRTRWCHPFFVGVNAGHRGKLGSSTE